MDKLNIPNVRCIVADMDGTLLNDRKELDSGIQEVLTQLQDKHILFTLASGRNVQIMKQYIKDLHIEIPYIVNNGACIYQGDECLFEQVMDEENLRKALGIYQNHHIAFIAYTASEVFVCGEPQRLQSFLTRLKGKTKIVSCECIDDIVKKEVFKVVAIHEDSECMAQIQEAIHSNCSEIRCLRSEDELYTITHIDANKGNALHYIMDKLHIDMKDVLVFGDNFNDVSMLKTAGIAVVMENAQANIKEYADHITYCNNEQGVSRFIKEFIL